MRWEEIGEEPCSIARALSVLGDRWTLLVLRNCFFGVRRFEGFQRQLGVTRHVLASRLKLLVEHEILEKVAYEHKPTRYEYRLTAKGLDLYPILLSLGQWGDRWMAGEHGAPIEYEHKSCGEPTTPTLACSTCGEPLHAKEVRARLGPGLLPYLEKPEFVERWSDVLGRYHPSED